MGGTNGRRETHRPPRFDRRLHRLADLARNVGPATASGGKAVAAALGGLRRGGVVISLGATDEPIELSAFELLFKQLGVDGALTGTPEAGDATLRFSVLSDVAAMIETMPLERAAEAYARMMSGKARFRMVLTVA